MRVKFRAFILPALLFIFAGCGSSEKSPLWGGLGDFTTFSVAYCSPAVSQYGVDPDARVTIIFNNDADKTAVERNFTLSDESGKVEGTFQWTSPRSFQFVPRYQLKRPQRYTISIPRTVPDRLGNKMSMEFLSDFYVGNDFTKPGVVATNFTFDAAAGGGTATNMVLGVQLDRPQNLRTISIRFSESMNWTKTDAAFSMSPEVSGYFTHTPDTLIFNLTSNLEYGKVYKITIGNTAEDAGGNTLANSFTLVLIAGADPSPPYVERIHDGSGTGWLDYGINSGVDKGLSAIYVDFHPAIIAAMNKTACESAFSISPSVSGSFSWAGNTLIFRPENGLTAMTVYTIKMDTEAKDSNDLRITGPYQVSIRTDAVTSQYITIGNVSGSNDNAAFNLLFTGYPAVWPQPIDMGAITGAPEDAVNKDYYFTIHFASPAVMDQGSLYGNIKIEGFGPIYPRPESITAITWESDLRTARIKLSGLWNQRCIVNPADRYQVLYRLTVFGGESGVKDASGNTLAWDFIFEFKEPAL